MAATKQRRDTSGDGHFESGHKYYGGEADVTRRYELMGRLKDRVAGWTEQSREELKAVRSQLKPYQMAELNQVKDEEREQSLEWRFAREAQKRLLAKESKAIKAVVDAQSFHDDIEREMGKIEPIVQSQRRKTAPPVSYEPLEPPRYSKAWYEKHGYEYRGSGVQQRTREVKVGKQGRDSSGRFTRKDRAQENYQVYGPRGTQGAPRRTSTPRAARNNKPTPEALLSQLDAIKGQRQLNCEELALWFSARDAVAYRQQARAEAIARAQRQEDIRLIRQSVSNLGRLIGNFWGRWFRRA